MRNQRRATPARGVRAALFTICILAPGATLAGPLAAQEEPAAAQEASADDLLKVFLDCENFICDFDHFRREVDFVDYVRDRADADVHVLVTTQTTGAGGRDHLLDFIGLAEFSGRSDTLRYVSRPDDTDAETRDGLARTFALGLIRYVAGTPAARRLRIDYLVDAAALAQAEMEDQDDPWNLWVFRIRVGGEVEGESRQDSQSFDGSLSANRTTEASKIDLNARGEYEEQSFELSSGETITSITRDMDLSSLVVWSLSPHWSVGVAGSVTSRTRLNQDLTLRASPAIEYNIYRYAESTRRQITFLYKVGIASFDYEQITLFDKTEETRGEHSLDISAEFRQPWGEFNVSLEAATLLDDWSAHRVDLFSSLEIRLFRGVSFDIQGSVARVKDQIYIPREEISDEDILLERRQLGTDFEYSIEFGLSFTFGSIFNNVVNPRMTSLGGGRFRF